MKLKLRKYTEPLTIEVERPDGSAEAVELELDFSDRNILAAKADAQRIVDHAEKIADASNEEAALEKMGALVSSAIDRFAGDGAAAKITAAFGVSSAADCVSGLVDVWKGINEEAVRRAGEKRVSNVDRYLDADA